MPRIFLQLLDGRPSSRDSVGFDSPGQTKMLPHCCLLCSPPQPPRKWQILPVFPGNEGKRWASRLVLHLYFLTSTHLMMTSSGSHYLLPSLRDVILFLLTESTEPCWLQLLQSSQECPPRGLPERPHCRDFTARVPPRLSVQSSHPLSPLSL